MEEKCSSETSVTYRTTQLYISVFLIVTAVKFCRIQPLNMDRRTHKGYFTVLTPGRSNCDMSRARIF
jgi:hypothetical protein